MAGMTGDLATLARRRIEDAIEIKRAMLSSGCADVAGRVADAIVRSLRTGGKVLFFGNGGSSMDAGHLAAELAGRFYFDRPALAGLSLSDPTASLTAIANDYSYEEVFARQVQALGRPGDVAVGLSTSGNSVNVVNALLVAQQAGLVTVALTGQAGGKAADLADFCIRVPTDDTPRVQEACLHLGHTICEIVERTMFARQAER
ncbi:MAG: SIS domain-containing protein [Actinomycetota bacterium]|nr:SIS domain-containing protein [Actinomycetota bacterium]